MRVSFLLGPRDLSMVVVSLPSEPSCQPQETVKTLLGDQLNPKYGNSWQTGSHQTRDIDQGPSLCDKNNV